MTKFITILVGACIVCGCGNTAEGVKKDSVENGQKMSDSAQKTGDAMKEGAANAGAAMTLTPVIKTALVANPFLNESGNLINVDSTEATVTLSGHVKSEKAKTEAGAITKKILDDKKATQTLKNDLEIKP